MAIVKPIREKGALNETTERLNSMAPEVEERNRRKEDTANIEKKNVLYEVKKYMTDHRVKNQTFLIREKINTKTYFGELRIFLKNEIYSRNISVEKAGCHKETISYWIKGFYRINKFQKK